ncbi:MAG: hypothetical protein AAB019_01195 [Planctomycetota bacterium]
MNRFGNNLNSEKKRQPDWPAAADEDHPGEGIAKKQAKHAALISAQERLKKLKHTLSLLSFTNSSGFIIAGVLFILLTTDLLRTQEQKGLAMIEEVSTGNREEVIVKSPSLEASLERIKKRNVFQPWTEDKPVDVFAQIKDKWQMKLSGTIIVPGKRPVAFIRNEQGNEGIYYEGDRLGDWQIKTIGREDVLIQYQTGRQLLLKMGGMVSEAIPVPVSGSTGPSSLPAKPPIISLKSDEETMRHLKSLIATLPDEVVQQRIEEITGIRREDIPPGTDLSEYSAKLIKISQDGVLETNNQATAPVYFSTAVNKDNSAQNAADVFSGDIKRIYGCFKNEGNLKGLKSVITRWVNLADGLVIYVGSKPVNPASQYNFVYMEKSKEWAQGSYQLELLKTGDLTMLARGKFEIK